MKRVFLASCTLVLLLALWTPLAWADGQTLTLPQGLKTIEDEAFMGDESLGKVVLPSGITTIGSKAFADSSVSEINLPASLQYIAPDAFRGAYPDEVTAEEGSYAWNWAVKHHYIEVEQPAAIIESAHPLMGSETHTYTHPEPADYLKITFSPESDNRNHIIQITSAEEYGYDESFRYYLGGRTIFVPGNSFTLTVNCDSGTLGDYGFAITDIQAMTSEEVEAYEAAYPFDFNVKADGTLVVRGDYRGSDKDVVIPSSIDGRTVTEMKEIYAYNWTSVTLPSTLTSIHDVDIDDSVQIYAEEGTYAWQWAVSKGKITPEYTEMTVIPLAREGDVTVENGTTVWDHINPVFDNGAEFIVYMPTDGWTVTTDEESSYIEYRKNGSYTSDPGAGVCTVIVYAGSREESGEETTITFTAGTQKKTVLLRRAPLFESRLIAPQAVAENGWYDREYAPAYSQVQDTLVDISEPLTLTWTASPDIASYEMCILDPDDDALKFVWAGSASGVTGDSVSMTLDGPFEMGRVYGVRMYVTDLYGNTYYIGRGAYYFGFKDMANPDWMYRTIKEDGVVTGIYITEYLGDDTTVTIPAQINGVPVTEVSGLTGLTDLTAIEAAADSAYFASVDGVLFNKDKTQLIAYPAGKTDASTYAIPEGVTSIGDSALYGCSSLTEVTIPEGVTTIGNGAFSSCGSLTVVTIPEGVTTIGNYAFFNCSALTAVTIHEGLESIGDSAFRNCSALMEVTIPEGVTSIGGNAFYNCNALTKVTIPEGVTSIGGNAFWNCSSLTEVTIPEGVTSLEYGTFSNCSSLRSVTIPRSVTNINYNAFYGRPSDMVIYGEAGTYAQNYAKWNGITFVDISVPVITVQPASVRAEAGDEVTFSVEALYALSYRWQERTIGSEEWIDVAEGGDAATLSITVDDGSFAKEWRCAVIGRNSNTVYTETVRVADGSVVLESSHPVVDGETFTYTHPEPADYLLVTFSPETYAIHHDIVITAAEGYDFSETYWEDDLAGRTILIPGNSFTITVSGARAGEYGFAITDIFGGTEDDIDAYYNEHPFTTKLLSDGTLAIEGYLTEAELYLEDWDQVVIPATIDGKTVTEIHVGDYTDIESWTSVTFPASITKIEQGFELGEETVVYAEEGSYAWTWAAANGYITTSFDSMTVIPMPSDGTVSEREDGVIVWENITPARMNDRTDLEFFVYMPLDGWTVTSGNENDEFVVDGNYESVGESLTAGAHRVNLELGSVKDGAETELTVTFTCGTEEKEILLRRAPMAECALIAPQSIVENGWNHDDWPDEEMRESLPTLDGSEPLVMTFSASPDIVKYELYVHDPDSDEASEVWGATVTNVMGDTFNVLLDGIVGVSREYWGVEMVVTDVYGHRYKTGDYYWFYVRDAEYPDWEYRKIVQNGVATGIQIMHYSGDDADVAVPTQIHGIPVTSLAAKESSYNDDLMTMILPETVTYIGHSAFSGYANLMAIYVDENNTSYSSIDGVLFSKDGTSLLAYPKAKEGEYTVPDGVTSIGSVAFEDCGLLTSVILPDGLTSIGNYAFNGCESLTSITIPASVIDIGWDAFGWDTDDFTIYGEGGSAAEDYALDNGIAFVDVNRVTITQQPVSVQAYAGDEVTFSVTATGAVSYQWQERAIGSFEWVDSTDAGNDTATLMVTVTEESFAREWRCALTGRDGNSYYSDTVDIEDINIINNWTYTIVNGACQIAGYSGSDTVVTVPSQIKGCPVTSIGDYAFYNCSALTSIDLPDGLTSIGNCAFYNCSALTSIDLPDGITSIGYSAFDNCSALTSVDLPDGITSIGYSAFPSSTVVYAQLGSDAAKTISQREHAFREPDTKYNLMYLFSNGEVSGLELSGADKDVTEVVVPDGVTSIGDNAFYNCSALTSIDLPDGLTSIGSSAFSYCSALTSIDLPDGLTSIGNFAFDNCSALTSVVLPDSINAIGYNAFPSSTVIYAPIGSTTAKAVSKNGHDFKDPDAQFCLKYQFTDGEVSGLSLTRADVDATYLELLDGITSIDGYAFSNCNALTTVILPDSLESIGHGAFNGCASLATVTIPESVIYIGGGAFPSTTILYAQTGSELAKMISQSGHDFREPDANYSLKYLFTGTEISGLELIRVDTTVTEFVVPDGVTSIGNQAFKDCSLLSSVILPDSVTSIGNQAFKYCSLLSSVILPDSVTSIGASAFYDCLSLTEITLPNAVTSINMQTFYGCSALTTVTLPDMLTEVGFQAFSGCYKLKTIKIPESVTSIGGSAFESTTVLYACKDAEVAKLISKSGYYFRELGARYSLKYLFSGNEVSGLELSDADREVIEVDIPEGVTHIGANAFMLCESLTAVTLPDTLTNIGNYAFGYCDQLKEITIPTSVTTIASNAFWSHPADMVIYGEAGSYAETYAAENSITFVDLAAQQKTPVTVTVTGNCSTYVYDGMEHAATGYEFTVDNEEYTVDDFVFTGTAEISATQAGSYDMGLSADDFVNDNANYDVTFVVTDGLLAIERATVEIQANSMQFTYDGAAHTCPEYIVTGLAEGDAIEATVEGSITNPEESPADNVITGHTFVTGSQENYEVIYQNGQLTMVPAAVETVDEGILDTGLAWSLDGSGKLTISGEGDITDFDGEETPWIEYSNITSVVIEEGVTSVGDNAFAHCGMLISVELPDSLIHIGSYAFTGCSLLASVRWPDSLTGIGDHAFYCCYALESVDLPDTLTDIGGSAFIGCRSLTAIHVDEGNERYSSVDGVLFDRDGTSLLLYPFGKSGAYTIPDGVTSIAANAFDQCAALTAVVFPESMVEIGERAFAYCKSLTRVTLNDSIAVIRGDAFSYCDALTDIEFSEELERIESFAFRHCVSLTSVRMPEGLTYIGNNVFADCASLEEVILPDSLTTIGANAFRNCPLIPGITIPAATTSIGSNAFLNHSADFIFYGEAGSYAETYAANNSITFVAITAD